MVIRSDLYLTGRKHCSSCGRWRLLADFQRDGEYLQAWCKTCQRLYLREKHGSRPREIGYCLRGHQLTPENTGWNDAGRRVRFCRTCYRERRRKYHRTEDYREYQRIYREAKRREAGIAPRPLPVGLRKTAASVC